MAKRIVKTVLAEQGRYLTTKLSENKVREIEEKFVTQDVKKTYPKVLKVKFRSLGDVKEFAGLIKKTIRAEDKEILFKRAASKERAAQFVSSPKSKKRTVGLSDFHAQHWVGMPEFVQEKNDWIYHSLKVRINTAKDYAAFSDIVRQSLSEKSKSLYYPQWTPVKVRYSKWVSDLPSKQIQPRYPIYIVSKGRAFSRLTSKALEAMNVLYFIVIEPKEYDSYASVIDSKKILVLPYDSDPRNPTGPGRARTWCRDHAWKNGHKRHWVLDDNIHGFYRLHKNRRYKVGDSAIFRAAEDFVDRYENVWVAGFQYKMFCPSKSKFPPFKANTRIYSCLLIDNRWLFKMKGKTPVAIPAKKSRGNNILWRERYNEDTILSLDVMENKFCTIQFNAFLQNKVGTQTLKGGNTEVFYGAEGSDDKRFSETGNYNRAGTVRKSMNLKVIYPEIVKIVKRFGRVHHRVDYRKYSKNKLIPVKGIPRSRKPNDYGMKLITMTPAEAEEEMQVKD